MNQYVFVIDDKGKFITSFVDNEIKKTSLIALAKRQVPTGADYIYAADGDAMLDEFLNGKLLVNGEFVDAPTQEPTKAERINEIKAYYNQRFEVLEQTLLRRRLVGADITDLQEQFKKLNAEMVKQIKAVK